MESDEERAEAAPSLYKGLGFLFSRANAASATYKKAAQRVTGIEGSERQYEVLSQAIDAMPHGQRKTVILNALGGYSPYQGQSLADRRRSISEHFEISPRTVFRQESRGVEDVIKQVDRILEKGPQIVAEENADAELEMAFLRRTNLLMEELIKLVKDGPASAAKRRNTLTEYLDELAPYEERLSRNDRLIIQRHREDRDDLTAALENPTHRNDL